MRMKLDGMEASCSHMLVGPSVHQGRVDSHRSSGPLDSRSNDKGSVLAFAQPCLSVLSTRGGTHTGRSALGLPGISAIIQRHHTTPGELTTRRGAAPFSPTYYGKPRTRRILI